MIVYHSICPSCGSNIPDHRHDTHWVICECGWMHSEKAQKYENETQKKTITSIIILSFILFTGFVHSTRWGNDAIRIIPLQTRVLLDIASHESIHQYAQLSLKHLMHEEGEHYLSRWAEDENTPEAWEEIALLRARMKSHIKAIAAFDKYYELGGKNPLTLFHYAQTLEEIERSDLAENIYVYIVKSDKTKYQVTVVQELVELLVDQRRFVDALSILNQLSRPGMELPSHLIYQKEWISRLIQKQKRSKKAKGLSVSSN